MAVPKVPLDKGKKPAHKKKKPVAKKKPEEEAKPEERTYFGNKYYGVVHTSDVDVQALTGNPPSVPAPSTYEWPEQQIKYEGPLKNSQITGQGKFFWPDGTTYEGGLEMGRRHGQGVLRRQDGSVYEGQWDHGERHGEGQMRFGEGTGHESSYTGQWHQGKKTGHGEQVWPSGNTYAGEWRGNQMSGEGEMQWATGDRYRGQWRNGSPDGVGEYLYNSGDGTVPEWTDEQQAINRYSGQWEKGLRHGVGTFFYANGTKFEGIWIEGKKHGLGKVTFTDGTVHEGEFNEDRVLPPPVKNLSEPIIPKGTLDVGGVDNPIRQVVDIQDLVVEDASERKFEQHSREAFNIVLRKLGELKQLYVQYRQRLTRPGDDPFQLTTLQLWLLCRDAGWVTPSCSYARINRAVHDGGRFILEVCPGQLKDTKVLEQPEAIKLARKQKRRSLNSNRKPLGENREDKRPSEDSTKAVEEVPDLDALLRGGTQSCAGTKFWASHCAEPGPVGAPSDEPPCRDIHAHHPILLRQFYEQILRIASVRFKGSLDQQVDQLVAAAVARLDEPSTSEWVFDWVEGAEQGLAAHGEELRSVFNSLHDRFGPRRDEGLGLLGPMVDSGARHANINGRFDATVPFVCFLRVLAHLGLLRTFLDAGELQQTLLGVKLFKVQPDGARYATPDAPPIPEQKPRPSAVARMGAVSTKGTALETFGEAEEDCLLQKLRNDNLLSTKGDEFRFESLDLALAAWEQRCPPVSLREMLEMVAEGLSPESIEQLEVGEGGGCAQLTTYELTWPEFVRCLYCLAQLQLVSPKVSQVRRKEQEDRVKELEEELLRQEEEQRRQSVASADFLTRFDARDDPVGETLPFDMRNTLGGIQIQQEPKGEESPYTAGWRLDALKPPERFELWLERCFLPRLRQGMQQTGTLPPIELKENEETEPSEDETPRDEPAEEQAEPPAEEPEGSRGSQASSRPGSAPSSASSGPRELWPGFKAAAFRGPRGVKTKATVARSRCGSAASSAAGSARSGSAAAEAKA